jgi:predicted dehydrogenase
MKKALRVGIVGCGSVAKSHLGAYRADDIQIVAICATFYPRLNRGQSLEESRCR